MCSGSLIFKEWVITSAHCVAEKVRPFTASFFVRLGSNHSITDGMISDVDKIIIHPKYDPDTYSNDIALVKLAAKVDYSKTIHQIDLIERNFEITENLNVTVTSYAATCIKCSEETINQAYFSTCIPPVFNNFIINKQNVYCLEDELHKAASK